ncbi:MAG: flagellar export protein FliJ [Treponema bryantii]|nr:flagellar export protein FliJ [Treponema bryantii]
MKKFKFELEQVLEIREFERQQAEGELSKCIAVENEINENLAIIANQYDALKKSTKGSLDFSEMMGQSQYANLLDYQKEQLLLQLAQAKLETEEKRKVLTECMKKTSALEKMKELQYEDFKLEMKRKENRRIEELSSIKSFSEN